MKDSFNGIFTVTAGEASGGKAIEMGCTPSYIKILVDEDATNPDVIEVFYDGTTTCEVFTTGSTGVVTVTANVTVNSNGFTVAAGALTEGDVNCYIATRL
jgi:hypothetical protein